jgi:hypothetical protein
MQSRGQSSPSQDQGTTFIGQNFILFFYKQNLRKSIAHQLNIVHRTSLQVLELGFSVAGQREIDTVNVGLFSGESNIGPRLDYYFHLNCCGSHSQRRYLGDDYLFLSHPLDFLLSLGEGWSGCDTLSVLQIPIQGELILVSSIQLIIEIVITKALPQ